MEKITYKISGADSQTFLQGLLTCDLNPLNNTPLLTACCNQKGRIVANFWIRKDKDVFFIELPKSMGPILQTHLQKYTLRSQVNIEASDLPSSKTETKQTIWILPETTEQFTPQMIDLQKHGGVSFTKGCYLGQEIIARTEHLGQLKRHLYQINLNNKPRVGEVIHNADKQKMGTVVAVNDNDVFAVIEDRAIDQALMIGNNQLTKITRP